jgi:hypothetical protein
MTRKPFTLCTLTIMGAACATGTLAGETVTALSAQAGFAEPGIGKLATALVALWTLHTLHALVLQP